jgi:hypothetical protein
VASANLFLTDVNARSLRHAVVEDDGDVAYLYLTAPGLPNVVASAWIYNRASLSDPTKHHWTIIWSQEGDSVAVLADGLPVACITEAGNPGYSRGLEAGSPLGCVWDDAMFAQVFREIRPPLLNGRSWPQARKIGRAVECPHPPLGNVGFIVRPTLALISCVG